MKIIKQIIGDYRIENDEYTTIFEGTEAQCKKKLAKLIEESNGTTEQKKTLLQRLFDLFK